MFSAIAAAHDHINIEAYIFDEAQYGGTSISDLLVKKATDGIAVNVLYDAVGSSATPPELFEKLKAAGVRVCEFNPLNPANSSTMRFTQRDHRKVLVIDGSRAFAGGMNFSASYTSGSRQRQVSAADVIKGGWRDTHIELQGPAGLEVQRLFLQSWAKQKCPASKPAMYLPPPSDAGDTLLRINASSTDSLRNETYVAALSALTFAKISIDLTMGYFAPNDHIEVALIAAARRGVRVRLLLAGVSDFSGIVHAGRAHYSRLLAAGVQIFEMHKSLLHAKTLEIDGIWSTVGSANWDLLSFTNNDELNVVVIDQGFAAQMRAMFADDLTTATQISAVSWAKRPIRQRILERFWATWQRML
jgi:cardiolipin synthase